ncbi:MAG: hypothetical protein EA353_14700 [Puniceicoccaceae bacterium]|nr:MAG: hypothetical protein EA353_14700 [Puniceicoccaceae bacterium]
MKKFYDKLIFILALIIVAGSGAFYLMNAGEGAPTASFAPSGEDYAEIEFSPSTEFEGDWPRPRAQSTTWIYDVFTPPKIYIDPETGLFSSEPIDPSADEVVPFGVYLARMEQDLYRFQFQGFVEVDLTDPSTSIIYIFDTEARRQISARKGRAYPESGFEIRDFTVVRQDDASGAITRLATVVLYDKDEEMEVTMRQGEVIYTDSITIELASREHPDFRVEVERAGDTFENPSGKFTVKNINLENQTVTVEKAATEDDGEPERRILSLRQDFEPDPLDGLDTGPSETAPEATPDNEDDFFQGLF